MERRKAGGNKLVSDVCLSPAVPLLSCRGSKDYIITNYGLVTVNTVGTVHWVPLQEDSVENMHYDFCLIKFRGTDAN